MSVTLSFRSRILRAGSWTISGNLVSQVMRLGSNLIMTRLLVPEMFGIMALANILMTGIQMMSDLGLKQHVVQSRHGDDPEFLNTVWSMQILRGMAIGLLTLLCAIAIHFMDTLSGIPAGSAYAAPQLPYVVALLALNAVIIGFESTRLATASRHLALGRVMTVDLACNLAGILFMIVWALVERSIWSLVFGTLFTSILRMLASHHLLPGTPNRLQWSKSHLHDIFHFGKWIFLTSILGFLAINADRLILGGLVDPATLGIYSIAYMMVAAIRDVFMQLGGNVAFPALSEVVRQRRHDLKQTYYKMRLPLDVVALTATGVLVASGHLLIQGLYDPRYHAAGYMMEIICIALFEVRYVVAGQCFMALGMPKLLVPGIAVRLAALFGLMPLAYSWWGLDGALWVAGASTLFSLPITFYLKIRHGLFDLRRELEVLPLLGIGYAFGLVLQRAAGLLGMNS